MKVLKNLINFVPVVAVPVCRYIDMLGDMRDWDRLIGKDIEIILKSVPGTASAYAERVAGGRYVTVDILRDQASRYGLNIDDVQDIVRMAIGGMNVTETVEGLEMDGQLSHLQEAFINNGAIQCGFCTPGMLISAKALLDRNPHPKRGDIVTAIEGNLCRCTGYEPIIRAIESVASE